ncbi:ryncolin-1-like isoform X2 [Drosophila novamexicana]|uniref:ryncolin-1-like isoform X2 n=1 Tax=Drosophila novamexicana TaxID=47314 RepID=UPI0011E5E91C|nr:ryncolin-1-like isoform X2 [Drosophila novamexicana]
MKQQVKLAVFEIQVRGFSLKTFRVVCEQNNYGNGWTIILRRQDGSEDFYRNWNDYKNGFGDLEDELFMGLEKIHAITAAQRQELLVLLEDEDGEQSYERYDRFAIGDELESFALHTLGNANGTAGDSFKYHHGQKFTTYDRDNDSNQLKNCAKTRSAAWWYKSFCEQLKWNI